MKELADIVYEQEWHLENGRACEDFWIGHIPDALYHAREIGLYDNRRVEPDWHELDGSWWIASGRYFDCNGVRRTPH